MVERPRRRSKSLLCSGKLFVSPICSCPNSAQGYEKAVCEVAAPLEEIVSLRDTRNVVVASVFQPSTLLPSASWSESSFQMSKHVDSVSVASQSTTTSTCLLSPTMMTNVCTLQIHRCLDLLQLAALQQTPTAPPIARPINLELPRWMVGRILDTVWKRLTFLLRAIHCLRHQHLHPSPILNLQRTNLTGSIASITIHQPSRYLPRARPTISSQLSLNFAQMLRAALQRTLPCRALTWYLSRNPPDKTPRLSSPTLLRIWLASSTMQTLPSRCFTYIDLIVRMLSTHSASVAKRTSSTITQRSMAR